MSCHNCPTPPTPFSYDVQYFYNSNCFNCSDNDCGSNVQNAKCIIYTGPNLPCAGIETNDSVEFALQKIDEQICSLIGDYSNYQFNGLDIWFGEDITTEGDFVNAITGYTLEIKTDLDTFTDTTFVDYQITVNLRFVGIEEPGIVCTSADVGSADTLIEVLNKFCEKFEDIDDAISIDGVDWDQCLTVVDVPSTIAEAFALVVDQICQVQDTIGEELPTINNTGSCLVGGGGADSIATTIGLVKTRLCSTPTFDKDDLTWSCLGVPTFADDQDITAALQKLIDLIEGIRNVLPTFDAGDFAVTPTSGVDPCAGVTVALQSSIVDSDRFVAATALDASPATLIDKLDAGTGISITNNADTTLVITNTAPDQVVTITAGTNISVTGTYPNFTVSSTATLTDEQVQDIIGGILTSTNTVILTYNDAGNTISADVQYQDSLTINLSDNASGLKADLIVGATDNTLTNLMVWDGDEVKLRTVASIISGAFTADNAVTQNVPGNLQWGGSLLHNTTVTGSGFYSKFENNTAVTTLFVDNTSTGAGIVSTAISGSAVIGNSTSGNGVEGTTSSGIAIYGSSGTGYAGLFTTNPSTTGIDDLLLLRRNVDTTTPTSGTGLAIVFEVEDDSATRESNRIVSKWTDVVDASRTSQLLFSGINSSAALDIMAVHGTGVVGIGKFSSFTGTRLEVVDDALAGASMVKLTTASTAAAGGLQRVLDIALTGANATASQNTFGIYVSNTHTGTTPINNGVYATTSGNGASVSGIATTTGIGVDASSVDNFGVRSVSTNSNAYHGNSVNGICAQLNVTPSSTATVIPVINVTRSSSGAGANGIGGSIDLYTKTSTQNRISNQIISKWNDATDATRTSEFQLTGLNSAATNTLLTVTGAGIFTLPQGLANHVDDAAAAAGGIPVNGLYRNGSIVMIRVS